MTPEQILKILKKGPRVGFGSDRETDRALQALRKKGKIRYIRVNAGGRGWELVTETKEGPVK